MLLAEIIFSIVVALLIGILFYYGFKYSGPWDSFWSFLLILLLAGLAASAWLEPVGPLFYNIAWVPILFVILLFAVFLAAASEPLNKRRIEFRNAPPEAEPDRADPAGATLGFFFWLFLMFLIFAVIFGSFW